MINFILMTVNIFVAALLYNTSKTPIGYAMCGANIMCALANAGVVIQQLI